MKQATSMQELRSKKSNLAQLHSRQTVATYRITNAGAWNDTDYPTTERFLNWSPISSFLETRCRLYLYIYSDGIISEGAKNLMVGEQEVCDQSFVMIFHIRKMLNYRIEAAIIFTCDIIVSDRLRFGADRSS